MKTRRALSYTFLSTHSPRSCGNLFIFGGTQRGTSPSPCIKITWRTCQLRWQYLQNSPQMLRRKRRSRVLTHRVKCFWTSPGKASTGTSLTSAGPTAQRKLGDHWRCLVSFPLHLLSFICKISPLLLLKMFPLRFRHFLHEAFHWSLEHLALYFQRILNILQRYISYTGFSLFFEPLKSKSIVLLLLGSWCLVHYWLHER